MRHGYPAPAAIPILFGTTARSKLACVSTDRKSMSFTLTITPIDDDDNTLETVRHPGPSDCLVYPDTVVMVLTDRPFQMRSPSDDEHRPPRED